VTSQGRGDVTSWEARDLHTAALAADPDHDRTSCWCCCMDCDFDAEAVWATDEAAGLDSVV
jgi:hypothetical protein